MKRGDSPVISPNRFARFANEIVRPRSVSDMTVALKIVYFEKSPFVLFGTSATHAPGIITSQKRSLEEIKFPESFAAFARK